MTSVVLQRFRSADPTLDPLVIASWATRKNQHLGDMTPAEWITERKGDDQVVAAARHAAQPLAA